MEQDVLNLKEQLKFWRLNRPNRSTRMPDEIRNLAASLSKKLPVNKLSLMTGEPMSFFYKWGNRTKQHSKKQDVVPSYSKHLLRVPAQPLAIASMGKLRVEFFEHDALKSILVALAKEQIE
jgi:hypothetical protein